VQRNENESFEDYKVRRAAANKAVKALKRGVPFHNSAEQGTYINWDKRELKAQRAAKQAQRKGN
jgi:hypothetical protein